MSGAHQGWEYLSSGLRRRGPRHAIAALLALVVATSATSTAEGAETRPLRFLTYNVWGLPRPLLQKSSRFADIHRLLPSLRADVVALQETFDRRTRVLDRIEGYSYLARGPKGRRLRQFNSGLLILSKHPIVAQHVVEFEGLCSGFDCLANKGMQHARIDVPGVGLIDVFNTHMNAFGAEDVRLEQVDLLAEFILRHSDPARRPIVMLGDYNYEPDSPSYRRMMERLGIRDTHVEHVNRTPGLPDLDRDGISSDPRRNANVPSSQPPKRIDYVFTRSDGPRVRVDRSRLVFDAPVNGQFLSDHFGVMADLSFAPEGASEEADQLDDDGVESPVLAGAAGFFTIPGAPGGRWTGALSTR
jgi:endonuclease/exonuclease/phosphatase family metal-dependent hydrolase